MRILIVEDEPLVARRVEQFCRRILGHSLESVQVSHSLESATARLAEAPIDIVLLDLDLSGEDGMNLLTTCVAGSFHAIIVSAHTEQAMRAFEFGVLDFVPKPCTQDRLALALSRVDNPGLRAARAARYLAVRKVGRVELIAIDDVAYVEGADKYSELVLADGRRELHDKTLGRLEAVLPPMFERIHKSYLVRVSDIVRLFVHEGSRYEAQLRNGTLLPVGRTRFRSLKTRLA